MKCIKCDNDLFPGQLQCEKCGAIQLEVKKAKAEKEVKEKNDGK